jgi:hypothetical protein
MASSNDGAVASVCSRRRCWALVSARHTHNVNQWTVRRPCFLYTSCHVAVTSRGHPGLLTSLSPGDTCKPKCTPTNLARYDRWNRTSWTKSEPVTKVWCVQVWLLSDHDYRGALHATETTNGMQSFQTTSRHLNGTLTPTLLNFRVRINQNSDLEIIIFYWHILYNFHQPPQCSRAAVRMHNCPHLPSTLKILAPELFFFISAHSVYKMLIIQEPNMLELWNKLHFEDRKKIE